jgi:imidazolonepropionase-like amidohydrolase
MRPSAATSARVASALASALAALALPCALPLAAQAPSAGAVRPPSATGPSRGALARGTFAITDVTVVPMTSRNAVLRGSTVVVRDGRIAAVGAAGSVAVPQGATRIDGRGKFLIPGLADMHTHLYSDGDLPDSLAADELAIMVANGVTAARFMIGTPEHLVLRREIAEGRVLGPQVWVSSPQLAGRQYENTYVVTTPEEARAAVRRSADAGYDFIKLTMFISRPVYDAIVDEGAKRGIRIVGHVDNEVGVARALEAKQQIEHLDNYLESALADSAPMKVSVTQSGLFRRDNWRSLAWIDDRKVAALAGATARAGVWSVPTLEVFHTAFAIGPTDDVIRVRPDWDVIPGPLREVYLRARQRYWNPPPDSAHRARYVQVRNAIVKAIVDSGGRIMAGSDTPEWFHVYGWALHRELQAFVTAGLTPWQALEAATRNPAEFLGAGAEWGTIEPGKRADLVLLAADPLADIRNTTRIEGVSSGGRWMGKPELERLVRTAVTRIGGQAPDSLRAVPGQRPRNGSAP